MDIVMTESSSFVESDWCMDNGVSDRMSCFDLKQFITLDNSTKKSVEIGDGSFIKATGIRVVQLDTWTDFDDVDENRNVNHESMIKTGQPMSYEKAA
ncbi:hypothetical protein FQR65_LT15136 [Abscondita terminalis]|nr:hypothetical protein FQR65_LT15136 [Abscondita terminalis]